MGKVGVETRGARRGPQRTRGAAPARHARMPPPPPARRLTSNQTSVTCPAQLTPVAAASPATAAWPSAPSEPPAGAVTTGTSQAAPPPPPDPPARRSRTWRSDTATRPTKVGIATRHGPAARRRGGGGAADRNRGVGGGAGRAGPAGVARAPARSPPLSQPHTPPAAGPTAAARRPRTPPRPLPTPSAAMFRSSYDQDVTCLSPQGRLFQARVVEGGGSGGGWCAMDRGRSGRRRGGAGGPWSPPRASPPTRAPPSLSPQVEYAMEAVKQGSAVVGVKVRGSVGKR